MLKYYEYLLKIRKLLHEKYSMNVLSNLEDFPIETDDNLNDYYSKIAEKVDGYKNVSMNGYKYDRFYIQSVKPFFTIVKFIMKLHLFQQMIKQVKLIE